MGIGPQTAIKENNEFTEEEPEPWSLREALEKYMGYDTAHDSEHFPTCHLSMDLSMA